MTNKNQQIPAVRFNGFNETWEQRKLDDISEKVMEKNKNKEITETLTNSAEYGIISQSDFFNKDISNINNIDGYYIVRHDDFVYNPRISNFAPVGPIKRNNLNRIGIMSPLYYVFRTKNIDPSFLEKYFVTSYWHMFMKLNGDSGARSDRFAIKDSVFKEMPIPYPSFEEQVRIGNFFKQIDSTIALHQKQLDNYKELKKAMLQKMFPQEGEKVPEIRFDGFTGDWKQRKLLDFSERICVGFVGTCEQYYTDSTGIPMYRTGNLNGLYLNKDDLKYVTKEFHDKNVKSQIKRGDILIARHGNNGKAIIYNFPEEANCLNIVIIRPNSNDCDYRFLAQCINSPINSKKIKSLSAGSTQSVINTKEIEKLIVSVPRNIEEQTELASFFSNLDNLITLHQQKITDHQQLKKTMLQQMFI